MVKRNGLLEAIRVVERQRLVSNRVSSQAWRQLENQLLHVQPQELSPSVRRRLEDVFKNQEVG